MNLINQITWPPAGRYVVAVSGGVDSVALLHLLVQRRTELSLELEATYIDHGWRDTTDDQQLVERLCWQFGVELYIEHLELKTTSEAEARRARYAALERRRNTVGARAVITAHHLNDRVETVALNLLRGTGRQGLGGLRSERYRLRPLLAVPKAVLLEYAREHRLRWVEDPTNVDLSYRRNWVRHELLANNPQLSAELLVGMEEAEELNREIDKLLAIRLGMGAADPVAQVVLPWSRLESMSLPVLQEALIYAGRRLDPAAEFGYRTVEQLAADLKLGRIEGSRQLARRLFVRSTRGTVAIEFKAP